MNPIYKLLAVLSVVTLIFSCSKEETIAVNPDFTLSFAKNGGTKAFVGTTFYVIPSGSGEYLTLYDGSAGHVWGEVDATGVTFNNTDSLGVNYNQPGKYQLTVVASSSVDFGKEIKRTVKTVEINVVDDRNAITEFYLGDNSGNIVYTGKVIEDSILVSVPDILTNYSFVPLFVVSSTLAKVYSGDNEITSGVSTVDFSNPLDIKVMSAEGTPRLYHVKAKKFKASDEKLITKFNLGKYDTSYKNSFGEVAALDQENSIINLSLNYGTLRTSTKLVIESSYASSIFINGLAYNPVKKNYNLNTITEIKIVAQNNTEKKYTLNLSDQDPFQTFTFAGLVPAPTGIINVDEKKITVAVLAGTDITKLAAKWTGTSGKVTVNGVDQVNGVTTNDFSSPVTFTLYKGTTVAATYQVSVVVK